MGQKSLHHLLTWYQLCVHVRTATQCRKVENIRSCAWIYVDNDVNISHLNGNKEEMDGKKKKIVSSIFLMNSPALQLLRFWEQNSFFCTHGHKKVHTDYNKCILLHSEALTVFISLKLMLLEMICIWENTYFPLHEEQTIFIVVIFAHYLKLLPGISGLLL